VVDFGVRDVFPAACARVPAAMHNDVQPERFSMSAS
jgi:hypothetical protein